MVTRLCGHHPARFLRKPYLPADLIEQFTRGL